MTGSTFSRTTGPMQVIARMSRRRCWTIDEKLVPVEVTYDPASSVAEVAECFEVSPGFSQARAGLHVPRSRVTMAPQRYARDFAPKIFPHLDYTGWHPDCLDVQQVQSTPVSERLCPDSKTLTLDSARPGEMAVPGGLRSLCIDCRIAAWHLSAAQRQPLRATLASSSSAKGSKWVRPCSRAFALSPASMAQSL